MSYRGPLRQATAQTLRIGPFVDDSDGNTVEGSLTITQPDLRLSKDGGNFAQLNAAGTLSHDELGWYILALDTTDTDTVGELLLAVHESGALQVVHSWTVVEESVYDGLYASGAVLTSATAVSFDTQITDSVPADGAIPTREEAIYMIVQYLLERVVSGTDVSVKKVDGSTELFGLQLDDGDNPGSISRDA